MPGTCIPNALPIDYRVPLPYGWDTQRILKEMLGLVEGGGLHTEAELLRAYEVEEEEGEQPPAASKAEPS